MVPQRSRRAAYDFYAAERSTLADAMRNSGCDILHAHWTYEFAAAALDAKLNCLITAHDAPQAILRYFVTTRYFPFWFARFLLGFTVVRRAKALTAVSPYCADSVRRFISPRAEMTVVPNGIESNILARGRDRLNRSRGIGKSPRVFMVMEGFQKRKNPKPALYAFAAIRNRFPSAELHIAGTGYGPGEEAERWASSAGLRGGVVFRGKLPHAELVSLLGDEADLLIHPALEESFGMAPLEAMALGIPVIGSRTAGGVPYVLDYGKAGVLADTRIAHEIASAAVMLLSNDDFCRGIADAGWARADKEFAFNTMVDRYEACYEAALASQPPKEL